MGYVYTENTEGKFEVGYHKPATIIDDRNNMQVVMWSWQIESVWDDAEAAIRQVRYLNGGTNDSTL